MSNIIYTWGSTAEERAESYPCERHIEAPSGVCYRAVDVDAPVELTFAWLCQLRVAPYSYDWIDNYGRPSPRTRDPENERLTVGQQAMRIFTLVEFERDTHLTMVITKTKLFGAVAVSYSVRPRPGGSRIVVKLLFRLAKGSPLGFLLAAGDLIMMRKQLLTLKRLAEDEHRVRRAAPSEQRVPA
jgi:hypothetical protein